MWTRLYDPSRTPPHWLEIIRPGECAVFVLDAGARVPRDAEGRQFESGDASVEITGGMDGAVRFAEGVVDRHPELCCEIYGHEGKQGDPLRTVYHHRVRGKYEGLPHYRREAVIGSTLLTAGGAFIVYDAMQNLHWMWGYFIGLKVFIIGVCYATRGIAGILEWRGFGIRPPKSAVESKTFQ